MKKIILTALSAVLLMASCADGKYFNDEDCNLVYVDSYGLFSMDEKVDGVHYEASTGSIIAGIVFAETIFAPIYAFGFDLYEPVCLESEVKQIKVK